jgi:hypothetical protein
MNRILDEAIDEASDDHTSFFKPPLGLRPRKIAESDFRKERALEIVEAMRRYVLAEHPIPLDWFSELMEFTPVEKIEEPVRLIPTLPT